MSDSDDFEAAIDEVNGVVTTMRKVRKWPIPPKGSHKALCIEAKLVEKDFQGHVSTVLQLCWELESMYEDEESKEQKKYRIYDSLSLFYGPKARLAKAFKELTGEEIEPLIKKKKVKQAGEEYIQEVFQYQAFTAMEAEITVVHKEGKADPSKIYANVAAYICQPEQQKKNAALVFDDSSEEENAPAKNQKTA